MTSPNKETECPACGAVFRFRSNKRFCSAACRKESSQKARRRKTPINAANSPSTRREQKEVYDTAMRLAEMLYSLPPFERLGFVENLVQLARRGESPSLRKILTNPTFIYPNPDDGHLFWRRSREYCTIAQAADRYCRWSPWQAGVADVVRGEVPEPSTGEVVTETALAA